MLPPMRIPLPMIIAGLLTIAVLAGVSAAALIALARSDPEPVALSAIVSTPSPIPGAATAPTETAAPSATPDTPTVVPPTETPVPPAATATTSVPVVYPTETNTPILSGALPPPRLTQQQVIAAGNRVFGECLRRYHFSSSIYDATYLGDYVWLVESLQVEGLHRVFDALFNEVTGVWVVANAPQECPR